MAIIQGNAKKSTSAGGFYPRVINGSLRFNDDDGAYLSVLTGTNDSERVKTFSCWVKRANIGSYQAIVSTTTSGNIESRLEFTSNDTLQFVDRDAADGTSDVFLVTNAVFRDPSAWYHIVLELDTTNTIANIYVNGVLQTLSTSTKPTNYDLMFMRSSVTNYIGSNVGSSSYVDGYLADVYLIDGQALDADDFGETKNGVWVAKDYEGTFGTNGFHLTFEDDTEVEAFNTLIWRGDSSLYRSITGVGFAPDFLWIKDRNTARGSILLDTIRGVGNYLRSDETGLESTSATVIQRTFDSDGFTLGNNAAVNNSNETYVAWCWKAGGTPTVDNSAGAGNVPTAGSVKIDGVDSTSALAGTIPATRLSASTTYGFSIVSYTGDGTTSHNVGHGLGVKPDMIIAKTRNAGSTRWIVAHKDIPTTNRLVLDDTFASAADGDRISAYDSTTFTHNWNGANSNTFIAYCWAEKTGYSKFGFYAGNGSPTGPIIYTTDDGTAGGANGFNPACLIVKEYDNNTNDGDTNTASGNWFIWDNTRDTDGVFNTNIHPNLANAEVASGSNFVTPNTIGFQLTGTGAETNGSGRRYIYAAFADTRDAAFWLDQSGNDNDWQPVNLDHNDTVADSPTDNFATLNPLDLKTGTTLSDGNLVRTDSVDAWESTVSTMAVSSGQYYAEFTPLAVGATVNIMVGVVQTGFQCNVTDSRFWASFDGHSYHAVDGNKVINGSGSAVSYGDSWTVGDVIGVALDLDAGTITFTRNGVSQGVANTGLSGTYHFACASYQNGTKLECNFGQQPFKYDPPA